MFIERYISIIAANKEIELIGQLWFNWSYQFYIEDLYLPINYYPSIELNISVEEFGPIITKNRFSIQFFFSF